MVGFAGAHNGAGNAFLVLGREDTTPGETPPLLPFDRLGRFGDSPETGEQDDGILRLVGAPGDNAGYALDGGGDIDGDGIPDIIIGAPSELTASGTFLSDGRVYVLSGSAAAQSEGPTSGPDLLIGTSGADRIDALAGNDTVRGLDGADTLIGAEGDDIIFGGDTAADLRDVIYGGEGNDSIDGGYGNDELRGDAGNDTVTGGSGVDTILGGTGDDVLTGQTWSDVILGGAGADFINGGFGHDRVNGGADADRFYHLGVEGHGSDWIQDFSDAEGDLLVFGGGGASVDDFQVNFTETAGAGAAGVEEAFVIYRPTGQILWALVDGAAQTDIMLSVGGTEYDLLA
ncbi:putative calcium-binding protein [Salipiger abyssi]|uniref:Putative calcium-binding protein n=3 Tax=Salipiger abyssi TaxID=1250539 RepID=A0A1P8UYW3_9RHOB|nr:putative calcium-binding protein [Salipiger abyssi]